MLCSLFLVEQFGLSPRLAELRGQKSVALEEDCNGRICSESVIDDPTLGVPVARLEIGTHRAREQDLSDTVDRLAASGVVERVVSVLRVEGD